MRFNVWPLGFGLTILLVFIGTVIVFENNDNKFFEKNLNSTIRKISLLTKGLNAPEKKELISQLQRVKNVLIFHDDSIKKIILIDKNGFDVETCKFDAENVFENNISIKNEKIYFVCGIKDQQYSALTVFTPEKSNIKFIKDKIVFYLSPLLILEKYFASFALVFLFSVFASWIGIEKVSKTITTKIFRRLKKIIHKKNMANQQLKSMRNDFYCMVFAHQRFMQRIDIVAKNYLLTAEKSTELLRSMSERVKCPSSGSGIVVYDVFKKQSLSVSQMIDEVVTLLACKIDMPSHEIKGNGIFLADADVVFFSLYLLFASGSPIKNSIHSITRVAKDGSLVILISGVPGNASLDIFSGLKNVSVTYVKNHLKLVFPPIYCTEQKADNVVNFPRN